MNLRKKLHVCSIASIGHLHGPDDHQVMIEMILSGQSDIPSGSEVFAAELLGIIRVGGWFILEDLRAHLAITAIQLERELTPLLGSRHVIWYKRNLIAAPFAMKVGSHRHEGRMIFPQPAGPICWKWQGIGAKWIRKWADHEHVMTPISPGFIGSKGLTQDQTKRGPKLGLLRQAGSPAPIVGSEVGSPAPSDIITVDPYHPFTSFRGGRPRVRAPAYARTRTCEGGPGIDGQLPVIQDELSAADREPSMNDDDDFLIADWDRPATSPNTVECAPAARARRGKGEVNAEAKPQAPKARRGFKEKIQPGEDDPQFMTVWTAIKSRHEAKEAFGAAGVGRRDVALKAWTALTPEDRSAASTSIDRTLSYRASQGWKLQEAHWFIKDRCWAKVPSWYVVPKLIPSSKEAQKMVPPRDHWLEGVKHWLLTEKTIMMPRALDPADWAAWSDADRKAFIDVIGRMPSIRGRRAMDLFRGIAPAAWMACAKALNVPATPEPPRRSLQQVAAAAARNTRMPYTPRKRFATFSPDDLARYRAEVGD